MSSQVIKGVTVHASTESSNPVARKNIDTIIEFLSLYCKDKEAFYALWVEEDPQVVTPFATAAEITTVAVRSGWDEVKGVLGSDHG